MSEESTALVSSVETSEAPLVHLVARNPAEMQAARADMSAWLKTKLSEVEMEVRELNAALSEAREHNWSTSALTRQRNKAVGQETFYFKLLTAVEAGYMRRGTSFSRARNFAPTKRYNACACGGFRA